MLKSHRYKDLKKSTVETQQFIEESRRSSTFSQSTHNSFLIEIDYNSDIDENIRTEINSRYIKSKVNASYRFPRISQEPFPIISLQQKFLKVKPIVKKNYHNLKSIIKGQTRVISHTPKPSLIKTIKKNIENRSSPSPESDLRYLSITPTPILIGKMKKSADFPKIKTNSNQSDLKIYKTYTIARKK